MTRRLMLGARRTQWDLAVEDEIVIAGASEPDLPAIIGLCRELADTIEDAEGLDLEIAAENCRALVRDPDSHILVARVAGAVVGFVNFTTRRTALHPGPSGLIDEVIVSKAHRGSGIGRMLVLTTVEQCRRLGCCEVEVSTEKSNSTARAFYRRLGFREDAVLLELQLE